MHVVRTIAIHDPCVCQSPSISHAGGCAKTAERTDVPEMELVQVFVTRAEPTVNVCWTCLAARPCSKHETQQYLQKALVRTETVC